MSEENKTSPETTKPTSLQMLNKAKEGSDETQAPANTEKTTNVVKPEDTKAGETEKVSGAELELNDKVKLGAQEFSVFEKATKKTHGSLRNVITGQFISYHLAGTYQKVV